MSTALYRKYRTKTLADTVGQTHITDILARSLAKGVVSHAYLLTGPRGVGKTSIARILAHEINKLPYDDESQHLDIIEIDAASNNGVEDVRDLREKVQIAPVSADKKIYIIDEVHMLSKQAFNALLKTLEEPPAHVVFILATTDADKLPPTIISRTQRFSFRAITQRDAVAHLRHIADAEKIAIDDEALQLIAEHGDGSFRDSIGLLDQLQSLAAKKETITRPLVESVLGLAPQDLIDQLCDAYESKDLSRLVELLDDSEARGIPAPILAEQLTNSIRSNVVAKPQLLPLLDQLLDVTKSSNPRLKLLTVLAAHAAPKPKTAALEAPAPTISAPLAELERQAARPKPKLPPVVAPEPPALTKKPKVNSSKPIELDWDALVAYARANFVAIYSVLQKCTAENDGQTLTIYTRNAFYKKKLDDAKHRVNLSKSLEALGAEQLQIVTIGTVAPPKDSQAATVAAIMGGGEEVALSDD